MGHNGGDTPNTSTHDAGSAEGGGLDQTNPSFWLDGFAITQHAVPGAIGVQQAHPEVSEIAEVIQEIGQTVLVLPGSGEPHFALRPCLRSWVLFEIANTPAGRLRVELGAAHSDLDLHRLYRRAIDELSVGLATATYSEDKRMVDELLLHKFGDYERVNTMLTHVLLDVFRLYYEVVYCHVDPAVIQIYLEPACEVSATVFKVYLFTSGCRRV